MQTRSLILAGAFAVIAAPAAWSQQTSEERAAAQREAAAAAAIEAQVAQAQAQTQAEQAQAQAEVELAQAQVQAAEREMAAARLQLERAAREVAIQTRRVVVDENGVATFDGVAGTPWTIFSGRVTRAQLGAALVDADDGAVVTVVTPGSGAADAGLRVGDVIRSIDGIDLVADTEQPSVEVVNRLAAI